MADSSPMSHIEFDDAGAASADRSRRDAAYTDMGLDEHTLRQRLIDEANQHEGEAVGVAFPGRGAVLWHHGHISFLGPAGERGRELRRAVEALVEGSDTLSGMVVRDLLLTMGGATLVVHRLTVSRPTRHQ